MPTSNYQPTDKENKFLTYHDALRGELNTANWHFTIYTYMLKLLKDYGREFNIALPFFRLTLNAHLHETVMRLIRFFDRRDDTMSIYQFLLFIEDNLDIFSKHAFENRIRNELLYEQLDYQGDAIKSHIAITKQMVERDKVRLEKLPLDYLRIWRNKALAHIDKISVLKKINVFRQYPMKPEQFEQIINTIDEILNGYYFAYIARKWEKGLSGLSIEDGIKEVFDSIRFRNTIE